ncbi:peroxisomal acyl-coenzyme A oxidase 1-like [Argonauta hians]
MYSISSNDKPFHLISVSTLEKDPNLQDVNLSDFASQEEKFRFSLMQTIYLYKKFEEFGINNEDDRFFLFDSLYPNQQQGFRLHYITFISTIRSLGTPQQVDYWLPKALNLEIIGCFAQTELGHGTFLKGLETTATYDATREQFVLNSPTKTAMKWWSGGLGKTATHCITIAQLYIGNKCYGIHPFILQIRSLEDHSLMPGVTTGDIGPKSALTCIDNGFMKLNNVRIPRSQLLMKYDKVLKDGTYVSSPNKKSMYASMMKIRCAIILNGARKLAEACTIAIRYNVVRQQSEFDQGSGEQPVLNFQTQQYRVFSALSTSYALYFTWRSTNEFAKQTLASVAQGKFDQLLCLHSLLSGLKSVSSWLARRYIAVCCECCGGHGISLASNFSQIGTNIAASCTYEGDNTVMILQTARFLLKCCRDISMGKTLTGYISYLNVDSDINNEEINANLNLPSLLRLCQKRVKRMLIMISGLIVEQIKAGSSPETAFNMWSIEMKNVAMASMQVYIMEQFIEAVTSIKDRATAVVLTDVCKFYCAFNIAENYGDFLQCNLMTEKQVQMLKTAMYNQMSKIRPNAVALVDAFDFSDRRLHSALGRYDGQVYDALIDYTKQSPLNKKDVLDSCKEYLVPFLKRQRMKAQL